MGITKGVVEPRLSPPAPESRGAAGLPADVLSEQARRIVLFSGVSAFMWSFGLAMDGLILPATVGRQPAPAGLVIDAIGAAITVGVFLFMRFVHLHTHTKCLAGSYVMLLNAALITVLEVVSLDMIEHAIGRPSWIAVLILSAAMIMPSTPRRTLVASLVASAMGPVAMGMAFLAGRPVPPWDTTLVVYLPNFIWAIVATMPSAMFQRLGRQLRQARALGSYELIEPARRRRDGHGVARPPSLPGPRRRREARNGGIARRHGLRRAVAIAALRT